MRHIGRFYLTADLLSQALGLPPGTKIMGASWDASRQNVELVIEDTDLPPIAEGCATPLYVPQIPHIHERYKWDWGTGTP